jgi:hypothetical protein
MPRGCGTPEECFWSHVDKQAPDEHWLWTGALNKDGYGQWTNSALRKMAVAHRWAWYFVRGPLSDHLHLDHLCRVRNCVNPDHLEPVTRTENLRRAGRTRFARACKKGHDRSPENTYISPQGARACRICMSERSKSHYWQKKLGLIQLPLPFLEAA